MSFKNLAHDPNCDEIIKQELTRCGIPFESFTEKAHSDVPYTIIGKLGTFTFHRSWYYWAVTGDVPIEVARVLYENPVGKTDIRVSGHCMCPPPEEWATWFTPEGKRIVLVKEKAEFERFIEKGFFKAEILDEYVFSDDPASIGSALINLYHIDSELGLYIFVENVNKYLLEKA